DCTDCPLKEQCTKAKGNRQVHWNTIFEEMKAKAKTALECEEKAAIYARRKVEVESVFGHIKGNRSFRRFSLRGLDKVHIEFGIVALAHNILKVAGIRQLLSGNNPKRKESGENRLFFSTFFILRTYRTASSPLPFIRSEFTSLKFGPLIIADTRIIRLIIFNIFYLFTIYFFICSDF
ncbi:Transposase DDE domain, partial [Schinkia azotoformans MEV2011]